MPLESFDPIINLAKRRGFIYPSAEIYGGTGGVWDYGPLGVLFKNNLKAEWWRAMVQTRADIVGLDSAIITKGDVLKASGHVDNFTDPLIECKNCHNRYRADKEPFNLPANVDGADETLQARINIIKCPNCGKNDWTLPRRFSMMFRTYLGAIEEPTNIVYLRPETAQGIFTNFKNVLESTHKKLPFGIAQIGKAFRNEIQTGNFIFRDREFEQMELEYFVAPAEAIRQWEGWVAARENWYLSLGMKKDNLRLREHEEHERAHYAIKATDIEYNFPGLGWSELEGIANRGDYDLAQHQSASGRDLTYFDEATGDKFLPYVIEPSVGIDRLALALLCDAYQEYPGGRKADDTSSVISTRKDLPIGRDALVEKSIDRSLDVARDDKNNSEFEIVLHLHPRLAPITVAVLPLMRKEGMPELAHEIEQGLQQSLSVTYDETASIGRRYRRADEVGTPWCVTVDFDSLADATVTVRDRDSMVQERIKISELPNYFSEKLS